MSKGEKKIVKFAATPKQMKFLKSEKTYVGYGGARGGGKSWVLRLKACVYCNKYPGIRVLIVRRTLEDVRKNHIIPLREMLEGIAVFRQADRTFYFGNGSVIEFQYYDSERDSTHFQGNEWDVIFIDEATQFEELWLKKIAASCRSSKAGMPKQICYTCNPGGPGHGYIKRVFIDRVYKDDEDPDEYEFIQAKVTDNRFLMQSQPAYVKFLKGLPPKLRAAWLDGEWQIYEGQFFETFRSEPDVRAAQEAGCDEDEETLRKTWRWTHVIEPFKPKAFWPIYRSFDWGYHVPFSAGYYTLNTDGVLIRIAELYGVQHSNGEALANEGVKWPPEKVFAAMQRFENEHPYLQGREITGVADPAIWDAQYGVSIAETAMKYGIFFDKGDHRRLAGWMQCQYRLMFDENGYAMFYVFKTCPEFIRVIPQMQYDENKPEDLNTKLEDHIPDEWRYMCMNRPLTPVEETEEWQPAFGADPLEQFKKRGQ